jgi:ribosomal protein S8
MSPLSQNLDKFILEESLFISITQIYDQRQENQQKIDIKTGRTQQAPAIHDVQRIKKVNYAKKVTTKELVVELKGVKSQKASDHKHRWNGTELKAYIPNKTEHNLQIPFV